MKSKKIAIVLSLCLSVGTLTTAYALEQSDSKTNGSLAFENLSQDTGEKVEVLEIANLNEDTGEKVEVLEIANLSEDTGEKFDQLDFWDAEGYKEYVKIEHSNLIALVEKGEISQEECDNLHIGLLDNLKKIQNGYKISKAIEYEDGKTLVGIFEPTAK